MIPSVKGVKVSEKVVFALEKSEGDIHICYIYVYTLPALGYRQKGREGVRGSRRVNPRTA